MKSLWLFISALQYISILPCIFGKIPVNNQKKSNFNWLFIALCFLNTSIAVSQSPVQVLPQVLPPAPIFLSNYADASTINGPLRVQIILNDFTISNREIKLKTYFKGNGISFQSKDNVSGAPAIFLEGGIPTILTNIELAPYFQFNNIIGITPEVYGRELPEGSYQFCFEVYDVLTGRRLSKRSCVTTVLFKNEPPFLVSPINKSNIQEQNPQNIVFQWTPRHINVTNVEYELSIVEIWDNYVDPQTAFLSSPPVFQTTTTATTYVYGPADPLFLPNKKYAWRVQAKAKQGTEEIGLFKNRGYSEIYSFSYATPCDLPISVTHETKGAHQVNISWDDFTTEIPKFKVRYRKKGSTTEWFYNQTSANWTTLWDLRADTTYEYQVNKICSISESDWTYINTFTTGTTQDETALYNCGIPPDINLENQEPLPSIEKGETFKAGDFDVKILEVSGNDGRFTGTGYVAIPYLKSIKVAVKFTNILINTDKQLAEGMVITTYNIEAGNIISVEDTIDTVADTVEAVGEIFEGDNDLDEIPLNFDIEIEDIIIEEDRIVITNPETGDRFDYPLGDDTVITDASGDVYHVDEQGNITKGGQKDEGGIISSTNVDGVSGNGDLEELTAPGLVVYFTGTETFGLDIIPNAQKEKLGKYYHTIKDAAGKDYTLAHQAVQNKDKTTIIAEVQQQGTAYELSDIIFKTKQGEKLPAVVKDNDTIEVTVSGHYTFENETIYAVVPSKTEDKKQLTAGAFTLWHLTDRAVDVVLVPVNGASINSEATQEIASIFKKGVASVHLSIYDKDFTFDAGSLGTNGLDVGEKPWLTAYNDEQKSIAAAFKTEKAYNKNTYYIFVLGDDISPSRNIAGFMPLQRQYGFIFTNSTTAPEEGKGNLVKTIAHEIGHGVFALQHPFTQLKTDEAKTPWLMDYSNGVELSHMDWAQIHNPDLKFYVFQDEEDGELANGIWFDPNWQTISIPKSNIIINKNLYNNPEDYKYKGTLPGFAIKKTEDEYIQYEAEIVNGKFIGYKNVSDKKDIYFAEDKGIIKIESPSLGDEVRFFVYGDDCNSKSYKGKYQNDYKNFDTYNTNSKLVLRKTFPCAKLCPEGQKFFDTYNTTLTNESEIEALLSIASLICKDDESHIDYSFLVAQLDKNFSDQQDYKFWYSEKLYYQRARDIFWEEKEPFTTYLDHLNKVSKNIREYKEIIGTNVSKEELYNAIYFFNDKYLESLSAEDKLNMLKQIFEHNWFITSLGVVDEESLILKIFNSVNNANTESDQISNFIDGLTKPKYKVGEDLLYTKFFDHLDDIVGNYYTEFIVKLTEFVLIKNGINKNSLSRDIFSSQVYKSLIEKATLDLVWDVEDKSFLWLFKIVNDNSEIIVGNSSDQEEIHIKQFCEEWKWEGHGHQGQRKCQRWKINESLAPFELVALNIINDITFSKDSGACNRSGAIACGKVILVPAVFLKYLDKKRSNVITQNVIANTLTAASFYFSGAEIIAYKGAINLVTAPAYADLFFTISSPYFSSNSFIEDASGSIQNIFEIDEANANEVAKILQGLWTVGSMATTIDTGISTITPKEHIRAIATYRALLNKTKNIDEVSKILSKDIELSQKAINGFIQAEKNIKRTVEGSKQLEIETIDIARQLDEKLGGIIDITSSVKKSLLDVLPANSDLRKWISELDTKSQDKRIIDKLEELHKDNGKGGNFLHDLDVDFKKYIEAGIDFKNVGTLSSWEVLKRFRDIRGNPDNIKTLHKVSERFVYKRQESFSGLNKLFNEGSEVASKQKLINGLKNADKLFAAELKLPIQFSAVKKGEVTVNITNTSDAIKITDQYGRGEEVARYVDGILQKKKTLDDGEIVGKYDGVDILRKGDQVGFRKINNAGGGISDALRTKIFSKLSSTQADELILELGKNSSLKAAMEAGEISSLSWKKIADGIPSFRIDKPNDYLTCLKKITQYEKGIGGSGTVKYYRVQGGGSGSATSRELLVLEPNGNMSFADKTKELYFSTDNIDHAAYYVNGTGTNINGKVITKTPANRPNGTIVEFEVPKWLDDKLKQDAIPQHKSGSNTLNNNSPQIVDYNQPGNPFGIKESWQTLIEENYIKGSVKVIE